MREEKPNPWAYKGLNDWQTQELLIMLRNEKSMGIPLRVRVWVRVMLSRGKRWMARVANRWRGDGI